MTKNMGKDYFVYIATNKRNTVLYTGVTGNLLGRMFQHKNKEVESFTSKYNIEKLVFCENFSSAKDAIAAEKGIKGWTRKKKIDLIMKNNPTFKDLLLDYAE
jgi:putative endonuclease